MTLTAPHIGGSRLSGFSINLAAISAALAAGPEAHPDPARRWVAGVTTGVVYGVLGVLGVLAAAVTTIADAAPTGVIATVAGVALIATFGSAASSALADKGRRAAAAITFVVAASGLTVAGIGAAFWALVAGGIYLVVLGTGRTSRSLLRAGG